MTKKRAAKKVSPLKGRTRTPPFQNYPSWSTSKFFSFLRSSLRSAYNKWPPKWEVLKTAQRPYKGSDKRCKWEYQCAECGGWFKSTDISVDHITPAGSLNTFDDLPGFCQRLFCGVEGLQCLCKTCHNRKTQEERSNK